MSEQIAVRMPDELNAAYIVPSVFHPDVSTAVATRRSVRAFLDRPVDRAAIERAWPGARVADALIGDRPLTLS